VDQCEPGQTLKMYNDHFVIDVGSKSSTTLYSNVFDVTEMLDLPSYFDKFVTDKTPVFKYPEGFGVALERAMLLAGNEESFIQFKASAKTLALSGKFALGQLDEEFALSKSMPKSQIRIDAKVLSSVKGVSEMSVTDSVAILFGDKENDFTYVIAGKETTPKGSRKAAPADDEE
jgi:hypothetical protein